MMKNTNLRGLSPSLGMKKMMIWRGCSSINSITSTGSRTDGGVYDVSCCEGVEG
jgi:hypothetical protein